MALTTTEIEQIRFRMSMSNIFTFVSLEGIISRPLNHSELLQISAIEVDRLPSIIVMVPDANMMYLNANFSNLWRECPLVDPTTSLI